MFLQDLGAKPEDIFDAFDREPIAAASLAQVFKAKTKYGTPVAVKVQYADLRERYQSDVAAFAAILDMIEIMHPKFSFRWVLKELDDTLRKELDFINEGKNSEKCASDLKDLPFVHVPYVLWPNCSHRILTTEFIDGIKISDMENLNKKGYNVAKIGQRLIRIFAEQVFHTGFVHADPHPGNLLASGPAKDPQIVLLDHGLYETMPADIRKPLARVWQAVVENDHVNMKKYSKILGVSDYRLFCMVLTQRYIGYAPGEERDFLAQFVESKGQGLKSLNPTEFKKLSEEEKEKLRVAIRDAHDKMLDVFQDVPSRIMLILRNLNIIRSIIRDHGSGVDRHRIMARVAVQGFFLGEHPGILPLIKGALSLVRFDLRLFSDWVKIKLTSLAVTVMERLGSFTLDMVI